MIANLFPLILLLVPGRAKESETPGPITVCDNIYPPASQSLLNLNCILQATVYQINTEILSGRAEKQLSLIEILRGRNLTWAEAINSLSAELKGLLGLRRKREVRSIRTCFDLMRQLDILVNQLHNGTQTKTYRVSSLRSILLQINSMLEDIQCEAQEKEFIASQMVRLDVELTSFSEYLANSTFPTTTRTTLATFLSTTANNSDISNSNLTWSERDKGR